MVGGVAGSFVAPSVDILGVSTEGSAPLLAGAAAIYVASALGALLGAGTAAIVAFGIGRTGRPRTAAISGSVTGTVAAVAAGYLSGNLAQSWVNAFSGNPLAGALVGGVIAGSAAGVAAASAHRIFRGPGALAGREEAFVAVWGSVLGLFAGMGGASIGATLAQSARACPNGFYANPSNPFGCVPGILQGSLLIGIWSGALMGAVGALATALLLALLARDSAPAHSTG